ncbi:MAG: hypothetical protein ACKVH0_08860 [Alphaproteobacteria bacterium]
MHQFSSKFLAQCDAELARIEVARKLVADEIRNFPTPFPAFDVHFTRLQEERRRLQLLADRLMAFRTAALTDELPLIHPRDTVMTADGGKRYQPEPVSL